MQKSISYWTHYKTFFMTALCCWSHVVLSGKISTSLSGQYTADGLVASNMNTLNSSANDFIWYTRSTIDYAATVTCARNETYSIDMRNAFRARYVWGGLTDTNSAGAPLVVAGVSNNVRKSYINKHLLWMREGWLKLNLGSPSSTELSHAQPREFSGNYIQLGLIPFEVGRGISLGAAYDSSGFLGFMSDFAIDQYAPAIVVNFDPLPDRYRNSLYVAILKNRQTHAKELDSFEAQQYAGGTRFKGSGKISYVVAWDHKLQNIGQSNVQIEPYVVYLHAPDQKVECLADSDIGLLTIGIAVEGAGSRFNWGFECGCNQGELLLKSLDRNRLSKVRNDDGFVVVQYTKVYDQDPKNSAAAHAVATLAHSSYVQNGRIDRAMNGQQIGPNLFNSYYRFRPEQKKSFEGYFMVADGTYELIPKHLTLSFGVGYASGMMREKHDANQMSTHHCMHQKFSGFVPLQSEYVGTRIRHIVLFNQGLPRCDDQYPVALRHTNLVTDIQSSTIRDLTNLAFLGSRIFWKPENLQHRAAQLSGNIVAYWVPESVCVNYDVDKNLLARDFLGYEIATEFACSLWDTMKCSGYAGIFVPGSFYDDNVGTMIHKFKVQSGNSLGFISSFAVSYQF